VSVRCPVCGEELDSKEALAGHDHEVPVPWEDGGAGYTCPECGVRFDSEEHLIEHQALGHGPSAAQRRG
jgi:hypothetical protein